MKIAQCYQELGQLDEAAAYLRDAIALKPAYSEAYIDLGMVELHRGRLADAEACLRQALKLRRRASASELYNRYHYALGLVLEAKGDLKGALAEYQAEIDENPGADDVRDQISSLRARGVSTQ
jgi:tetratricopeptide (TPR) repeat protein